MTTTSYPFDGQATSEAQYSQLFRELQDSGIAASADSTALKVASTGLTMQVTIQPGFAILRGHAFLSTAVESLTIGAAAASQRIDRIVLRLNPALNSIVVAVSPGVAGSGAPPALVQTDSGIFELSLAIVTVGPSVTSIATDAVVGDRIFVGSRIGIWTTDTRPASFREGKLGLNRTTSSWEFWNGTAWTDLAPVVAWANISDMPATFPPSTHSHSVAFSDLTGTPSTFTPSAHGHDWGEIAGKPATFPPASHSHAYAASSHSHAYAPASHDHDGRYLRGDDTIGWANGTKKCHNNAVGGSGTYYSVWVQGDGVFGRNVSSIRYKENVRDSDVDAASVLALEPVVYDRKADENGEGNKDEFGLIAEQVANTLPEIVVRNEEGVIDAVRYDLLSVALLAVVKDQESRIARLEALVLP